jgi:hypothetical protein
LALSAVLTVSPGSFVGAQTVFDPSNYSVEEFNRLRQTSPLEHLNLYRRIVPLRVSEITASLRALNWQRLEAQLDRLHRVLANVLEDIDLCAANPKNRSRIEIWKMESVLRDAAARLNGVSRSLPPERREKPAPVIQRLNIGAEALRKYRKPGGPS